MKKLILSDVVEITKNNIKEYFKGNPKPWFDCLVSKSVSVYSGENILFGAENIKKHLYQYSRKERGKILHEEYIPISISDKAAIVIAQTITSQSTDESLSISSYYTFIYQQIGKEIKLVYEHVSYEYFKKGKYSPASSHLSMDMNTFQFIKQLLIGNPRQERLCIINDNRTIYLNTNAILYIQSSGHEIEIHCIDKVVKYTKKISELMKELPENFYRIHRSYIINTYYLTSISCYEAEILICNTKIPIPAINYGQVKKDLETLLKYPLHKKDQ